MSRNVATVMGEAACLFSGKPESQHVYSIHPMLVRPIDWSKRLQLHRSHLTTQHKQHTVGIQGLLSEEAKPLQEVLLLYS